MRIDYHLHSEIVQPMLGLGRAVEQGGLDENLLELVKVRASQLNGCAYCLQMHASKARVAGETSERLDLVGAWQDAPGFSERERAALLWCEELTLIAERRASDEAYELVRAAFTEEEICALTLAIVQINGWNRFAVAFRMPVEHSVAHT